MGDWLVVSGPASTDLAARLAEKLNAEVAQVECRVFPDGESKVRVMREIRNRAVILVQSTYPPVNRHLIQALLLSHRLSEDGAEVHAVVPYLAYARQDKEFLKGEVVSIRVVARLFRSAGVKRLVTVDVHSVEGLSNFSIPAYSVSAIPLLAEYIRREFRLKDPIAVSPDIGGSSRVEAFSRLLGIDYIALKKARDRVTGEVKISEGDLDVEGRDIVIVDDIISTGGSVSEAATLLKESGAGMVIAVCTHPILIGDALQKLHDAGVSEVVGTNTIPSPVSRVDVSPAIAEYFNTLG